VIAWNFYIDRSIFPVEDREVPLGGTGMCLAERAFRFARQVPEGENAIEDR
jgi:hypothetical protein